MFRLEYASCEETGILSKSITGFLERLKKKEVPMHSVILAHKGKIITEGYYAPYKADTLHRMFSISKSFTSLAIGLLIEEGKLSLEDKIITYFPEKLPEDIPPYLEEMTIKDMLKMESCHGSTTYKADLKKDWVESFFITEPDHKPGTVFNYDTSASHTLCALVEKLTKKPILEFMREKCLDEIGFSKEAYMVKDPFGVSMGGSGLMATPMDLMRLALLLRNKGKAGEKQLIPQWYIEEATSLQTHTRMSGSTLFERQGYGYQFWRVEHGGFACYGMGGQFLIVFPKEDFICITTADTQGIQGGNQMIFDSLYEEILSHLIEDSSQTKETLQDKNILQNEESLQMKGDSLLKDYLEDLAIEPLEGKEYRGYITKINGKLFSLKENASGFNSLCIEFHKDDNGDYGILTLTREEEKYSIPFGLGSMRDGVFPIYHQTCVTSGVFLEENGLYIKSHIIDECIGSVYFYLTFLEDNVAVSMKKIEEYLFKEFMGYLEGTSK